MKWSKKEIEKAHWMALELEISIFETFLEVYKRTAPGVRYYVNCTEEQDAESHKNLAKDVLQTLRWIKECDVGAYKAITQVHKNDLKDVIAVYRESKKEKA